MLISENVEHRRAPLRSARHESKSRTPIRFGKLLTSKREFERESSVTRFLFIGAVLVSLCLLACDEDEAGGSNAGDGDGDATSGDGDGDGDDDVPMEEDAFCGHARVGFAALDDYITVMNEL